MTIGMLQEIIATAKEALVERKRLERLHARHIGREGMTRARTTTYNANASNAAERATFYEKALKALILG